MGNISSHVVGFLPVHAVHPGSQTRPQRRSTVAGEALRFAAVGFVAYAVDVFLFNLLLLGTGCGSVTAKVISSAVAITVAFTGSRWFTWPGRAADDLRQQYALFVLLSIAAAGIQLACLVVSHHLLGFTSATADNVSGNVVGMALATLFRFWSFRRFVFPPH